MKQKFRSAKGCGELKSDSSQGNSHFISVCVNRHGKFWKNEKAQSMSEMMLIVLLDVLMLVLNSCNSHKMVISRTGYGILFGSIDTRISDPGIGVGC